VNRLYLVALAACAWSMPGGVANASPVRPASGRPAPAPAPALAPVTPDSTSVSSRPQVADTRHIIGLLDVRVDGIPDEVKDNFQRRLEEQLDSKQYRLADRAYMRQMLQRSTKWTDGCLIGTCLTELRKQTGAEMVLLAALTGVGTSIGYVVTLVRTDTGRVVAQDSDHCDVCRVSEVMDRATLATLELLNKLPDQLPDEAAEQSATVDAAVGKVRGQLVAHDQHTTRLGLALTVIGVAVAATGLTIYAVESDRPTYAAATAVGGAALAIGGITIFAF
jgi:hypothetical protein